MPRLPEPELRQRAAGLASLPSPELGVDGEHERKVAAAAIAIQRLFIRDSSNVKGLFYESA